MFGTKLHLCYELFSIVMASIYCPTIVMLGLSAKPLPSIKGYLL